MSHSKKVLAVSSAGGHWTQLQLLSDAFNHCDVQYLTTTANKSARDTHKDILAVPDADLSTKLQLIPLALRCFMLVLKHRPNIVISTGAAVGFFSLLAGKIIGAKTIWIDSMANYSSLSVSGRHASKFCDVCLTQWPDLADGKKVVHFGSLL